MNRYYTEIKKRISLLTKELDKVKLLIGKFPEGKLICARNGKNFKWYIKNNGKTLYLPKKEKELAGLLAEKRYYESRIEDMERELRASKAYVRQIEEERKAPEYSDTDILLSNPGYEELLSKQFLPMKKKLQEWMSVDYTRNNYHQEGLIIKGTNGRMLRSKSEAIIDRSLFIAGIPFRYEEKLVLGDKTLYPDFVIRHPVTGEFYYWEHFGMMDDEEYLRHACDKTKIYCKNGIIPSVNLIITYETRKHPLSVYKVEMIIEEYFGCGTSFQ